MLAVLGLVIIAILTAYKVNGAILIGIVIVTLLGIPAGVTTVPSTFAKVPDFTGLGNVMFNLDFKSVFSFSSVILIFTAFCGDFFSTLGQFSVSVQKPACWMKTGIYRISSSRFW